MAAFAAFGIGAMAQNAETLTPTADTWVRTDNAGGKYATQTKMEVKDYVNAEQEKDIKFYGVVSFTLNKPEGYSVKSAKLRLTSERIKTNRPTSLYYLPTSVAEADLNYNAVAEAVATALQTLPSASLPRARTASRWHSMPLTPRSTRPSRLGKTPST